MAKPSRNPAVFETLALFGAIAGEKKLTLDEQGSKRFAELLEAEMESARRKPSLIHGLRAEIMFKHVAASLGECVAIKSEDAGDIYSGDLELRPPDYRVVLKGGRIILVEVKNVNIIDPNKARRFKRSYINTLVGYGKTFGHDVFIAVYWSRWGLWTMTPVADLLEDPKGFYITMLHAVKQNHMELLGDWLVGVVPPLRFSLLTDASKNREIGPDGGVQFTVGGVEIASGDGPIKDPDEQAVAFYLMLYGGWPIRDRARVEGGELISIDFVCEPEETEDDEDQEFSTIGFISKMLSNQYNAATAPDGKVERLEPERGVGAFKIPLPLGRERRDLRIWTFRIHPADLQARQDGDAGRSAP